MKLLRVPLSVSLPVNIVPPVIQLLYELPASATTWLVEFSFLSPTIVLFCAFAPKCSAVPQLSTSPPVNVFPSPCCRLIPYVPAIGFPPLVAQSICSRTNVLAFIQSVVAGFATWCPIAFTAVWNPTNWMP